MLGKGEEERNYFSMGEAEVPVSVKGSGPGSCSGGGMRLILAVLPSTGKVLALPGGVWERL